MAASEVAVRVSEACEAGEKFVEVFYKTVDKQRQVRWRVLAATTSTCIHCVLYIGAQKAAHAFRRHVL